MDAEPDRDSPVSYVSTGHLPPPDRVAALVEEAYEQFKSNREGRTSSVYPSLAAIREDLFGICVVGTGGRLYATGRLGLRISDHERVQAVCVRLGVRSARR